ncbi:MAG: dihydrolipoyl dehydrogenase [Actinomycetaceae bacterium]|nr:dihydrolipoyl dehydrogenase [Actinomycetaceae bacterium]
MYDVVVLGGGSGGYAAALRSAQLGKKVALIEGDKLGGTCLHRGCIPTKALLHVAEEVDSINEAKNFGISATLDGIDMAEVGKFRDGIVNQMFKGLSGLVKSKKIDMIQGWGKLVDGHTVEVDGQKIQGENIVLATGSYSKSLPGLAIEGRVITSDQALKLDWVPRSAVVLGGGVIGVEFASLWTSMGSKVTILEGLPHLVPNEDEDISKGLERELRKRGIDFHLGTMFKGVTQDDNGIYVEAEGLDRIEADLLLVAVGRGPRTAHMGYEECGIAMERGFVLVDNTLKTNLDSVYAVGDIVPGLQLAHRGFAQGIFVAEQLAGMNPQKIVESGIPRVTFCEPQIASVGLTQKQAEEKYGKDKVVAKTFNLAGNGKSRILNTGGIVKLVAIKDAEIVGFHTLGKRMGEQVGEGQLMVNWEAYPDDVAQLIHAHPTQNEAIGEAAMALAGRALHG